MDVKTILIGLVIGVIVGGALGYAAAPPQALTQSQLAALQAAAGKVPGLETQVSTLTGQLNTKTTELTTATTQITTLQGQLATANSEIATLRTQIPPLRKGAWNLLKTFNGVSDVDTDYFYVGQKELRMNYTFVEKDFAVFSVFMYKEDSTVWTYAHPFIEEPGSTYVHSVASGNYYLKVGAANIASWKVTVEVWVPA